MTIGQFMLWAQYAMTVGHCAINLDGWGRYKPRSSSMVKPWWRSKGLATWKLKKICILWYLNPGLLPPNSKWMVMNFFMYITVKSHRKIPKVQNFQFSSFFIRKKMCSSSWTIFLKFKRQSNLRVTDQCQDQPSTSHFNFICTGV